MQEYEEFCRTEAQRRGIDPETAVIVANSEGGLTEAAREGNFSGPPWYSGKSWWAFQLHYGGAGYEHFGTTAGMGNSFTALTSWQPGEPRAWRDAMRYALDAARQRGWAAWYGAKARGITGFDGIDQTVAWGGTPDGEWDYKQPSVVVRVYDRYLRVIVQDKDFDCSQHSLQWALWACGRRSTNEWLEQAMIDQGVLSREKGLLDGSGGGLADFVTREYRELGFSANNEQTVTFNALAAEAGSYPLLIGGHHWGTYGHWAAVRSYDAERDVLLLANPADGHAGVGQDMTRAQFEMLGPFSMVRVLINEDIGQGAVTRPSIPQDYIDKFGLSGPDDIRGLIDNFEGVVTTSFEQGKEEGLAVGRIPADYVTKFNLADEHDMQGLIENFEGVIETRYQQGIEEGMRRDGVDKPAVAEEVPVPVPVAG